MVVVSERGSICVGVAPYRSAVEEEVFCVVLVVEEAVALMRAAGGDWAMSGIGRNPI